MKKNLLNILFLGTIGLLLFQACQNDPEFPDPGFEIEDQRVEVRRDTADFYDINIKMNVPNGVETIDILDATDYSLLDMVDGYSGKTKFDFNYRVDLTPFEKDTVLNYIIKVVDKDQRSFNQGIRIDVKGFSFPEIKLVGGTNISVAAPAFVVKGIASAGLNNIETITISFEGKEQYRFTGSASDPVHEKTIKELVFLGNLESGLEYSIDIFVADDKGQSSSTTITVRKSETIKKPTKINMLDTGVEMVINIELAYDDNGNLTQLDYKFPSGVNYHSEYHYNELNMLDTLLYRSFAADGTYPRDSYTYYNYIPGTTQLSSIESQDFNYDSSGNTSEGDIDLERSEFVYDASGKVLSFKRSNTVSNIYYSDPFDLGENIYGEYWQFESYMSSTRDAYRQHREDYDPVLIPTYMESIPPFIAPTSTMLPLFNDLFWHKYMMTKTVVTDPTSTQGPNLRLPAYTYEADADGNITSIVKTYTSGGYQWEGRTVTYSFFYN
ncbi:hypothetical protein [Mangrovimonas sp. DI 80]|uniref:hypothetical protein n=1 Tax=Mangrovimonas sp. DI 80 TaxID=1779330 RepID=UPI000977F5AB|nr:hypothetical protein [Mangrovimonas sp. DI 80]OMP30159.1 hypothetical protein BKM32_12285 [Mangrovimonas sp. DI 80]